MRAVVMHRFGGPEVLTVAQVPDAPQPQGDQVRIAVVAAAINPVDYYVRSGAKADELTIGFPMTPGWDVSGVVEAIGPKADRFQVGDTVIGMSAQAATGLGTWAERMTVGQGLLAPAPRSVSLVDAAALPLAGLSSFQALDRLDLPENARVLVTGAAGALGGFAMEFGRLRGWRMAAVVRGRDGDQELVRRLGAVDVLTDITSATAQYDGVFETAGIADAITAVRDGGQFVSVYPPAVPASQRGIDPVVSFVEQDGAMLELLSSLVDCGKLTVRVAKTFKFDEVIAAVEMFDRSGTRGKVLLVA